MSGLGIRNSKLETRNSDLSREIWVSVLRRLVWKFEIRDSKLRTQIWDVRSETRNSKIEIGREIWGSISKVRPETYDWNSKLETRNSNIRSQTRIGELKLESRTWDLRPVTQTWDLKSVTQTWDLKLRYQIFDSQRNLRLESWDWDLKKIWNLWLRLEPSRFQVWKFRICDLKPFTHGSVKRSSVWNIIRAARNSKSESQKSGHEILNPKPKLLKLEFGIQKMELWNRYSVPETRKMKLWTRNRGLETRDPKLWNPKFGTRQARL